MPEPSPEGSARNVIRGEFFAKGETGWAAFCSTGNSYTSFGSLWLPQLVVSVDLVVSMPKVKTHHWSGVTLAMKNMFSVIPGAVYGWPKNALHLQGIERSNRLEGNAALTIESVIRSMAPSSTRAARASHQPLRKRCRNH